MKISVLTPTYNDGESIRETAKSLTNQTYSNWEWIIVNDGSTDNTDAVISEIVEEYAMADKCVYLHQENGDQLNALLNGSTHITGDYVFILHSDDLLPSNSFFQQCVDEMQKDTMCDGLLGDLIYIDEKSCVTGIQKVKAYKRGRSVPALMLLWLGRNLYADVAFHKTSVFLERIKDNYLTWNMPFWLYYEQTPQMVNYKSVPFPLLKYRIHTGNYINDEIGKHNVLNGELRTAIKLMHHYKIPCFKIQFVLYRVANKMGLESLFRIWYKYEETNDKSKIIDYIIQKRFPEYDNKAYFKALYCFYKNQNQRVLDMSQFSDEAPVYCGKDVRLFNRALLNETLHESYHWFMTEMQEGFSAIKNYEHLGREKVSMILKFFCIEEEVEL